MLDFLRTWLFPPACVACDLPGPALCAACTPAPRDAVAFAVDGVPAFALGAYDGPLRRAIVAMKRGERDPLDALADLLAERAPVDGTLVPLPTTRSRVAERGFDQSVVTARHLAARRGAACAELLVKRGAAQDGRSRYARLRAAGRFRLRNGVELPTAVTVVDDVCTTGATLRDAIGTLAAAGVAVRRIVVLARTAPDRARPPGGTKLGLRGSMTRQ